MFYDKDGVQIYCGGNGQILATIPDNSIDTIITDPPYGLEFMGQKWDYDLPPIETWQACLRVLKPGGILMSFGGTRTYHRITCDIEDAGFFIRDCIMWIHGQGFPKSENISKRLDKMAGAKREVIGLGKYANKGRVNGNNQCSVGDSKNTLITIPATPEAELWDGWGTALKPAYEPILIAMKHLDGTFAENALKWGVAGLWIDECRIDHEDDRWPANVIHDGSIKEQFSRYFYCAKPSTSEKGSYNDHPTVKPLKLMRYLCRLTRTPTDGIVLDPFMGSGTTIKAARLEGRRGIGIDSDEHSCHIAISRIEEQIVPELQELQPKIKKGKRSIL